MAKYRALPVEVEAVEWVDTEESWVAVCALADEDVFFRNADGTIAIETLTARARAVPGDFIVKGQGEGDIYPMPAPVFAERFEAAS